MEILPEKKKKKLFRDVVILILLPSYTAFHQKIDQFPHPWYNLFPRLIVGCFPVKSISG